MKTRDVIVAIILLVTATATAQQQGKPNGRECAINRLITDKIDYLEMNVPIDGDNIKQFAELYRELETKKFELSATTRDEVHNTIKDAKDNSKKLTDEEYISLAEKQAIAPYKLAEIDREYFYKFKEILSPKELYRLYLYEKKFAKHMIDQKHGKGGEGDREGDRRGGKDGNGDRPQKGCNTDKNKDCKKGDNK